MVLVSHAPGTIERACRRVVVLDAGRVVFDGPTAEGLRLYHRLLGLEEAEPPSAGAPRSGAVSLREAVIQDGEGRSRQIFSPGERMRVVMDLAAREGAPDVEVVIEVKQASGGSVFRTSATTATGAGQLSFEVPQLALLGGDYDIAISLREPGDTTPHVDRLLTFSVADAEGAEGIADLRGTWTFVGPAVEVGR